MSLTKLSLVRNNLYMSSLFPPRESLVSDIPAGDENIKKAFFTVHRYIQKVKLLTGLVTLRHVKKSVVAHIIYTVLVGVYFNWYVKYISTYEVNYQTN